MLLPFFFSLSSSTMKVEAAKPSPLSSCRSLTSCHSSTPLSILNKLCCLLSPKKHKKPQPLVIPSKSVQPYLSIYEFKTLFHHFDEDGDGKISPVELKKCMVNIGEELSLEDAVAVVLSVDSDGDGLLCFDDFLKLAKAEEEVEEEEKKKSLWEAFRVYVMEGEGCITPKSLRIALDRFGESKTIEECTEMIRPYDINGDGVIGFEEFEIMML